jgi:transcriptional regulator with XRE-family HTH domain
MYGAARDHRLSRPKGLNANYISRWERGVSQPSPHHLNLLCLAFELPASHLGFDDDSAPHAADHPSAAHHSIAWQPTRSQPQADLVDSEDVKRREFAKLLTIVGVSAAGLDLDRWAAVLAGTRIDEPTLDDMTTVTADLMARAATVTPYSLLPAVRGHLQGICQALAWTPAGLSARAHSLAGQTALLAGYLMLQQERLEDADAYWSLADRFGDMAGNTTLQAALRVHQAWRWEDSYSVSIALLNQAESLLGPQPEPTAAVMVLSTRADRHADASHADPAHTSLAMRDLDSTQLHLSRMHAADNDLYVFRSVTNQAINYQSNALVGLGLHRNAATGLEQLLALIDPSALSLRSYVTTDLAEAIAGMGEPEHACDVFSTSLDLATSASSPRCVRLVRDRQRARLAGYDGPAARRLDEQMRALALPSPADRPEL